MSPPKRFVRSEKRKSKNHKPSPFVIPRAPETDLQFEMDDAEIGALIKGWQQTCDRCIPQTDTQTTNPTI